MLIAGTIMDRNSAREGGGAVFDVVNSGWGALTFNESQLHNNISGAFETFPGIYYELDGTDSRPVMIDVHRRLSRPPASSSRRRDLDASMCDATVSRDTARPAMPPESGRRERPDNAAGSWAPAKAVTLR